MIFYSEAIARLRPGANWGLSPADQLIVDEDGTITNLWWNEINTQQPPTVDEIVAKCEDIKAEWEATQYQRDREPEYPPLAELADAIYWQQKGDNSKMEAYLAKVEAIKTKYPKGV